LSFSTELECFLLGLVLTTFFFYGLNFAGLSYLFGVICSNFFVAVLGFSSEGDMLTLIISELSSRCLVVVLRVLRLFDLIEDLKCKIF